MAFKILDRARMSAVSAPGTGDVTLGARVSGYQSFVEAGLQNGDTFAYSITEGTNWEFGVGTYTASGTKMARGVTKTSNQNTTPISFTAACTITAVLRAEDVAASSALAGLNDVQITPSSGIDGEVVYWDNAAGFFKTKAIIGSTSALDDLTDVTITSVSTNQVLKYNGTAWVNASLGLATVATTGAYSDLSGRPSLATVATSGAYSDLSGRPSLATVATSGSYTDLSSKPTIPTTLAALTGDVNVTEGSGIDGYSLVWSNSTSKWIASNISGGGGGGTTALSGLTTDVLLTSPANNDVLTYETSSSKWKNKPASGGGGGGVNVVREQGPFAPPTAANWSPSGSAQTTVITDVSGVGMSVKSAFNASTTQTYCFARKAISGFGSTWAVTARLKPSHVANLSYGSVGLMVVDSGGKNAIIHMQAVSGIRNVILTYNASPTTYNSNVIGPDATGDAGPDWFRIRYDGTNLIFGVSYDGQEFGEYSASATAYLANLSYIGLGGNNAFSGGHFPPANYSLICTYYDDPADPASGRLLPG